MGFASVHKLRYVGPTGQKRLKHVSNFTWSGQGATDVVDTINADGVTQGFQFGNKKFTGEIETAVEDPTPEVDWIERWANNEIFQLHWERAPAPGLPGKKFHARNVTVTNVSEKSGADGKLMQTVSLLITQVKPE